MRSLAPRGGVWNLPADRSNQVAKVCQAATIELLALPHQCAVLYAQKSFAGLLGLFLNEIPYWIGPKWIALGFIGPFSSVWLSNDRLASYGLTTHIGWMMRIMQIWWEISYADINEKLTIRLHCCFSSVRHALFNDRIQCLLEQTYFVHVQCRDKLKMDSNRAILDIQPYPHLSLRPDDSNSLLLC